MMTRRAVLAGSAALPAFGLSGGVSAAEPAVHLFNILPIKPDAFAAFLPVMQANAKASRAEASNISFDVFQAEDGSNALLLFESWKSRAALSAHFETPHLKAVEARRATDFSGSPISVTLMDVPGLPAYARKPIPDAATTRNVIVRLRIKPEARATFVDAIGEAIPQARAAPGNYVFDLYQEARNPNAFVLFERWQSVAQHEAHLAKPYSKKLDGIVPGTLAQPPERYLLRDVAA